MKLHQPSFALLEQRTSILAVLRFYAPELFRMSYEPVRTHVLRARRSK